MAVGVFFLIHLFKSFDGLLDRYLYRICFIFYRIFYYDYYYDS